MQKPQTEQNAKDQRNSFLQFPALASLSLLFSLPLSPKRLPHNSFALSAAVFQLSDDIIHPGFVLHQKGNGSPPGVTLIAVREQDGGVAPPPSTSFTHWNLHVSHSC